MIRLGSDKRKKTMCICWCWCSHTFLERNGQEQHSLSKVPPRPPWLSPSAPSHCGNHFGHLIISSDLFSSWSSAWLSVFTSLSSACSRSSFNSKETTFTWKCSTFQRLIEKDVVKHLWQLCVPLFKSRGIFWSKMGSQSSSGVHYEAYLPRNHIHFETYCFRGSSWFRCKIGQNCKYQNKGVAANLP